MSFLLYKTVQDAITLFPFLILSKDPKESCQRITVFLTIHYNLPQDKKNKFIPHLLNRINDENLFGSGNASLRFT